MLLIFISYIVVKPNLPCYRKDKLSSAIGLVFNYIPNGELVIIILLINSFEIMGGLVQ